MNLLNVILSAVLSGIMSYVAIINMSNEKFNVNLNLKCNTSPLKKTYE